MSDIGQNCDLPELTIAQPVTYRRFRLVVQEVINTSNHQLQGIPYHKSATLHDLANHLIALPAELRERLKALL